MHSPPAKGSQLGRYIVLEQSGTDGIASLYSAYDPQLDRKVALKLVPNAPGGGDLKARLLLEGQALARLSHPNIITVYDAGCTPDGQVFVATELVAGKTLRHWLEEGIHHWKDVLKAFIQAGRGLAAAHVAGIAHHGFTLDDVLWGSDGRIRVRGFGLEQLAGAEADAGSDQFVFCVALYEALGGGRPSSDQSPEEVLQAIPAGRKSLREKNSKIPGWLDRIILRGLSSRPQDRFTSMYVLVHELEMGLGRASRRTLALSTGLAIVALATGGYVAYRHRLPSSCVASSAALEGIWDAKQKLKIQHAFESTGKSFAADTWTRTERILDQYAQAWADSKNRSCADSGWGRELPDISGLRALCLEQRLAALRSLSELFARADSAVVSRAVSASNLLDPPGECQDLRSLSLHLKLTADPSLAAKVHLARVKVAEAKTRWHAGKYREAMEKSNATLIEAKALGFQPLIAEVLLEQGYIYKSLSDAQSSERSFRGALEIALAGRQDRVAVNSMIGLIGLFGASGGRAGEAELLKEQAMTLLTRSGGDRALESSLLSHYGWFLGTQAKYEEAIQVLKRSLNLWEEVSGPYDPQAAAIHNSLGYVESARGHLSESVQQLRQALAISIQSLGPRHPVIAVALSNLATTLTMEEKFDEAASYFQQALEVAERELGPQSDRVAAILNNLAIIERRQGHYASADRHLQRALVLSKKLFGLKSSYTANVLWELGMVRDGQRRYREAVNHLKASLVVFQAISGRDHPDVVGPLQGLSIAFREQGRWDPGLDNIHRALAIAKEKMGSEHPSTGFVHYHYANLLLAMGKPREAIFHFQKALEISRKTVPEGSMQVGERLAGLGTAYLELSKPDQALPLLERANQIGSSGAMDLHQLAERKFALARALWQVRGERARVASLAAEARELFARAAGKPSLRKLDGWLAARPQLALLSKNSQ